MVSKDPDDTDAKNGSSFNQRLKDGIEISFNLQKQIAKIISNRYVLFGFTFVIVWITLSTVYLEPLFSLTSLVIFLLVFFNFTLIALQFGYVGLINQ